MNAINGTTVLLCAVFIGVGVATKAADTKASQSSVKLPVVRVTEDTFYVEINGRRLPAVLKGLGRFDTTMFNHGNTVTVKTALDTLVVSSANMPIDFLLVSGADTVWETFVLGQDAVRPTDSAKLDLLRRFNKFGSTVPPGLPAFTYTDKSDSTISLMRREYKLDSIAGSGDEITRALRLMRWIHRLVRWDGLKGNPEVANGYAMLKVCVREGLTANCGGMASMLNSVLLAEGLKSRALVCRPHDTTDSDCHCVDMVFIEKTQKWVLIDPTFDAYFLSQHGEYLSPAEVRRAMIDGDSLILPNEINCNGLSEGKESYLNYMAKDLFRFSCLTTSSRDSSNKPRERQIFLSPTGYQRDRAGTIDSVSKWDIEIFTDDSSVFWKKPQ